MLDFGELQPGARATAGIRQAVADLDLGGKFDAKVELTGQVPMNDDQFSVIRHSAARDTLTALLGVLIILWFALRSWKIIAAVIFSLMVGLAVTSALGLAMVGAFNLISIAFFVLFVGLGVDFGIQFSVRYRTERHEQQDLRGALRSAARKVGAPLTLAAAATAVGILFVYSYRLQRPLGIGADRRVRHVDRIPVQYHPAPGDVGCCSIRRANRRRSASRRWRRWITFCNGIVLL